MSSIYVRLRKCCRRHNKIFRCWGYLLFFHAFCTPSDSVWNFALFLDLLLRLFHNSSNEWNFAQVIKKRDLPVSLFFRVPRNHIVCFDNTITQRGEVHGIGLSIVCSHSWQWIRAPIQIRPARFAILCTEIHSMCLYNKGAIQSHSLVEVWQGYLQHVQRKIWGDAWYQPVHSKYDKKWLIVFWRLVQAGGICLYSQ